MNRRSFLASAMAGSVSLLTVSPALAMSPSTRQIPSTDIAIPAVGLGTWITFNVGNDPVLLERSTNVIRVFVEEGGGMIDSSPMYGSAQETLGHGLSELRNPKNVFTADKVWTRSPDEGPAQLADTRQKWGVDQFDLVQVHNLVAADAHLEMLFDRKAAGEIGYVGITTSHGRRHSAMEDLMRRYPLDFVQLTYNVADLEAEARLLPLAQERGIGVIVNRPFRRGELTSRTGSAPLPGFAADLGAESWAELMLKFILSHPAVTVAIPATTNSEHVRQNKRAARTEMPDAALREAIRTAVSLV
ncbi:MAG: aldo/keto reductase [Pseudomonadota bacterium]